MENRKTIESIRKFLKWVLLSSLFLSVIFLMFRFPLPGTNALDSRIYETEPEIITHTQKTFEKEYGDKNYKFTSYGTYEIFALVVEKYDSENILDYAHRNDPAQSKDLCIVWGKSAEEGKYLSGKFSHGEFTCFFRSNDRSNHPGELTNNHLIPASEEIKKTMDKITTGDQVRIFAELVDYNILDESGNLDSTRKTNLILGDHQCEVLYVHDIEIIKPINFIQRYLKTAVHRIFLISIAALGLSFLI